VDRNALEIGDRLVVIAGRFHSLRRIGTKHVIDVAADILEFDIGGRKGAVIAAGACERDPWGRGILAALI
jgi:hypothetical protein